MRRPLLVPLLAVGLALGCGGSKGAPDAGEPPPPGPYDDVPLAHDLRVEGLDGAVHVVRDEFGTVHISAGTIGDLAFAQGYMTAHDRLPQMDVLRRFGAGTLSELFGALEADVVETDLTMRVHRMGPLAEAAWAELQSSTATSDRELVTMLERYADGVNAYNEHVVSGRYQLDPEVLVSFDPDRFRAWTPVDSIVLGRFQAFALSYTAPVKVDLTDVYQAALEIFDRAESVTARLVRRGAARDLLRTTPIGRVATIDGFPNVDADTGSRADGGAAAAALSPRRPHVPRRLLDSARQFFQPRLEVGPHSFMVPRSGSNNWVVGPEHAGGKALLAGDQHLSLPNPSLFYPIHLVLDGRFDVQGITFPGIPGVVLGHNGKVAWSATVVFHDVNDVYLESIVPCAGGGDCVVFDGDEVPVEAWTEEIKIGALGTITETMNVTYERTPHHGPFIPTIENRRLVPRTDSEALSVRYTGYEVTHEIRTFHQLLEAESVEDAIAAFAHFEYGGQNWVFIDNGGNIGWTTNAKVPLRSPATYTWHPVDDPDGLAPFFVLPGDGSAEWEGYMDPRYIPHAINPEKGYLVTANSDPIGVNFDGDPLGGPIVDGRPLYLSAIYAAGLRTARITELIEELIAAGDPITLDDLAAIQHDSRSNYGHRMGPLVSAALAKIDTPGDRTGDVTDWLESLPDARVDRLRAARAYLDGWSLATPPAVGGSPSEAEVADSVATTIFNVWVHFALGRFVGDELAEIGWNVYDVNENITARTLLAILEEPETLGSELAAQTGQPWLCDDMATAAVVESCDLVVMQAMDQALTWLEDVPFGSADMDTWVWGRLHTLTLKPLFPNDSLEVPARNDPNPDHREGFPNPGDNFAVDRADNGYNSLNFRHDDGPAQRFLAEVEPGGTIRARMALPGGTIYNRTSPFFRNLMDEYFFPRKHFDLPYSTGEIVSAGHERWVFRN